MRARGRSVWYCPKRDRWIYEARVAKLEGGYLKRQRTAASRLEAEELVEKLYQELKSSKRQSRSSRTFQQCVNKYLELKSYSLASSTVANHQYLFEKYLFGIFGERTASEISSEDFLHLFAKYRNEGLSATTVNKLRAITAAVYKFAITFKWLSENPISVIPAFRRVDGEHTQVQEPWSPEEAKEFLSLVQGTPIDFAMHVTLSLGLRKGEALGIRWEDVNFEQGWIDIKRSRSASRYLDEMGKVRSHSEEGLLKTKSSRRRLELTPLVAMSLLRERERQESQGWILRPQDPISRGSIGRALTESTLYRRYKKICDENNLRKIRIHDHRHTAAVIALESHVEPLAVSYGLGHASFEITRRIYAGRVVGLSRHFSIALSKELGSEIDAPTPTGLSGGRVS